MKPIPDIPKYYASENGHIYSEFKAIGRSSLIYGPLRKIKPHRTKSGYESVSPILNGRNVTKWSHRLILKAYSGDPGDHLQCSHLNGIRWDNRPENLKWETQSENFRRKTEHGTQLTRDNGNKNAILSSEQVNEIYRLLDSGCTQRQLAKKFKVAPSTISYLHLKRIRILR